MKEVIKYQILQGDGIINIEDKMNAAIKDVWQPLGGIHTDIIASNRYWCQAMVKYSLTPNTPTNE